MKNTRQALDHPTVSYMAFVNFFEIFPTSVVLKIKWALSNEFDEHSLLQGSGELVFAFQ